jgi:hypothetical protein
MTNSFQYIDALDDILNTYNNTVHRSIGIAPSSVNTLNESKVFKTLYPKGQPKPPKNFAFAVGDTVRLSKQNDPFVKGYKPGYTEELFTITEILRTAPTRYKVKDAQGDPIEGSFYTQEMIKATASPEKLYKIEKIIKTRNVRLHGKRVKQLFVKWLGYSDKFNSWIDEKDSQDI